MFNYVGRGSRTEFDGRRIEVQVRTRLQHSWATTVEAVGLFRGEQLKNHQGSGGWLRLFELMSGEIADAESCPMPSTVPLGDQRRREIKDLAKALDALGVLESVGHGFRETDIPLARGYSPSHYLIRYNHRDKTVRVEPHDASMAATRSYDIAEDYDNRHGGTTVTVVLVEVGKLNSLKRAMEEVKAGELEATAFGEHVSSLVLTANYRAFGNLCGRECRFLDFHHTTEDREFFPPLLARGGDGLKRVVERLIAEHRIVHALLEELAVRVLAFGQARRTETFAPAEAAFTALRQAVVSHFGYEEVSIEDALGYHKVLRPDLRS